jgi:beta-galactosidase
VASILSRADVHPLLPDLPEGVEVTVRQAADRQFMFILNTREQPIRVRGVPNGLDLLTGTTIGGNAVDLGQYGCSIVQVRYAA